MKKVRYFGQPAQGRKRRPKPSRHAVSYQLLSQRNLSTTLRHRRFLFTDSFLLLWKWRVG